MTPLLLKRFLADYGRNRANLLLLVLVPVAFVLVASPALADASRLLGGAGGGPAIETVTAGWAAAFLAAVAMYFQVSGTRDTDRRLVLAGMPRGRLAAARLLTGVILAVLASVAAMAALLARGDVDHPWRVAAGTLVFGLVYVGLGAAVGAVVPNAVNGTVVLLFIWILDVFFGPTLSGTQAWVVRLLPTHFVSLWTVDLPSGHTGPSELAWSLLWAAAALTLATAVVLGRRPHHAVESPTSRPAASLRAGLRMGWRDWRRTPVLWALLAIVPAVFILLAEAITPHGQTPVALRENGITRVAIVDPADMHAGTMAPIAVRACASSARRRSGYRRTRTPVATPRR
ncbi:ABC transporter permease [Janibacter sp. G1551]|uniref:ABC transporter permease n=1 Tax=Janibacter sp. G1551 TaxID=3420440 RepID=UPI003D07C0FE